VEVLANIWYFEFPFLKSFFFNSNSRQLAKIDNNSLDMWFPEFCLAMFLIKLCLTGNPLPLTIPDIVLNQVSTSIQQILPRPAPPPIPIAKEFAKTSFSSWSISPTEKSNYDKIFKNHDVTSSGYIMGK
jgi:hypothetical protein